MNSLKFPLRIALASLLLCTCSSILFAQTDTTYRVALILPFQSETTIGRLDEITNAHDLTTANRVHFNEDATLSLDYYQGTLQALNEDSDVKVQLNVYDSWNSDSVTAEILKQPEMQKMDFIIGSMSTSTAKLVADFCKQNHILNIQPFTPSKSLTTENIYHLKLAPTIDAHIDNLFLSILDSFPDANIIIYTPKNEKCLPLAQRFDSLFRQYDSTVEHKYPVSFINTSDQMVNGKKTSLNELIDPAKTNILILTSYDEPFVQSTLRSIYEKSAKTNIVVYGLPTWLSGDILRLDYLNAFHTRLSDAFLADTAKQKTKDFIEHYAANFFVEPAKYSYLGYDVMNFLMRSVKAYGKDFLPQLSTQRYTGTGYKFDIGPSMKNATTINYYENNRVNVLKVEDFRLKKVW